MRVEPDQAESPMPRREAFDGANVGAAAAAVSVSRYTGRNHFLSDVLVGSALGYGIGRRQRQHHPRGLDPQLPIVMLSAWEDLERQQDALAAGANAYVTKPFDVDALLARVQACLNGS